MADFVLTTVAREDLSRPLWPACPAHGWQTGVHKLTSLPIAGGNLSIIPVRVHHQTVSCAVVALASLLIRDVTVV